MEYATKPPNNQTTKPPNHQTTKQLNNQTTKQLNNQICLEDNTERSESNPGRSLGIYDAERQLSGRQYQNIQRHRND